MRLIADLHLHSRYSLATSSKLTPTRLDRWARIKGIDLLGTGDCTHPAWLAELREALEPVSEGLFALKAAVRKDFDAGEALAEGLPDVGGPETGKAPRFALTGEVCTIYSRDGKTRKVHHLVILPDFAAAAAFQTRLSRVAKIESDGRPILGLDSRELFKLLLDADDRSILVPAHIWTPWFSALGGKSGFDSIEECYGEFSPRIGAIETGLSSNPPMNWAVSGLDRFSIISNSDAHSPEKLGREATLFDMEDSFAGLAEALAGGGKRGDVAGTIEFFPQEGKYHYDGHRACRVVLPPEESEAVGGRCPVCGKPLTSGVLRRVCELADRPVDEAAPCPDRYDGTNRRPYWSLIPLKEILSELLETSESAKKVAAAYLPLVRDAGSEFSLLLDLGTSELEALRAPGVSGELLAAAIGRMRDGRVSVTPGYDGEYGVVRVFAPGERLAFRASAPGLFAAEEPPAQASTAARGPKGAARRPPSARADRRPRKAAAAVIDERPAFPLDPAQERAVNHAGGPALIIAGPGTGKTAVLALRIERLVAAGTEAAAILALTFTNKAAAELRSRIALAIGAENARSLVAATFHSFCLSVLRERAAAAGLSADFSVLDEEARLEYLRRALSRAAVSARAAGTADTGSGSGGSRAPIRVRALLDYVEARKRFLLRPGDTSPNLGPAAPAGLAELAADFGLPRTDAVLDAVYAAYRDLLREAGALDYDDLVAGTVRLLSSKAELAAAYRSRFRSVFVDEYQDVNFAQYALIRLLVPGSAASELCVIGDPNQAIYGFRGADRRFIDRFLLDYPEAATYRLTKSFRCAPAIIGAAGRLVGTELAGSGHAVALSRYEAPTEAAEAERIAREIERLIGGTRFFAYDSGVVESPDGDGRAALRSLGECAILVRAAALAPPLEKALLDHGLPYVLVGDRPWWEAEPAKTLVEALKDRAEGEAAEAVRAASANLARRGFAVDAETAERLASLAALHRDRAAFLDALALGAPADGYEKKSERVALMTIHAAKGLEFDHVFIAGLEEGILPFTLYDDRAPDAADVADAAARMEEERRLLYVAMTRARIGLHVSSARSRAFRGRSLALPPSRFLAEIAELLSRSEEGPRRPRESQLGLF